MARFRLKPVEVDAIQWTGHNVNEVAEVTGNTIEAFITDGFCVIRPKGLSAIIVNKGDWIIRHHDNRIYAHSPYIFEEKYEPVEPRLSDSPFEEPKLEEVERGMFGKG